MSSVSGIFLRSGFANTSQPVTQPIQHVAKGAYRRQRRMLIAGIFRQLFTHGLGRHSCEGQGGLESGVCLAFWFDQCLNPLCNLRVLFLGLSPPPRREVIDTRSPAALLMESHIHGVAAPAEHFLGMSRTSLAISHGHLCLELPPPGSREFFGCRSNRLAHRCRKFLGHRLLLETDECFSSKDETTLSPINTRIRRSIPCSPRRGKRSASPPKWGTRTAAWSDTDC